MIKTTLKTAALSMLIGFGALAAAPASAQAGGIYLEFGSGHRADSGFRRHDGGWRDHGRHFAPRRSCNPRRAVRKAHRMGLRHARIHRIKRHKIVVKGWDQGYRARIVFARAPRCPVLAYR